MKSFILNIILVLCIFAQDDGITIRRNYITHQSAGGGSASITFSDSVGLFTNTHLYSYSKAITISNNPNRFGILFETNPSSGTHTIDSVVIKIVSSGARYNFTRIDSMSRTYTSSHHEMWGIIAPPVGADSVLVYMNGANTAFTWWFGVYYNVNQSTPYNTPKNATGFTTTPAVSSVTSAADEFPIGAVGWYSTRTITDGQTTVANTNNPPASGYSGLVVSTTSAGATFNLSYILSSTADGWGVQATSLIPAP